MNSHSKVKKLLLVNQQKNMESIMVFVAALFTYVLLPQLLIRYVYADQQLLEVPPTLEYIPVGAFAIAMLHFVYVVVSNMMRNRQIAQFELEAINEGCCGGGCHGESTADLEDMLDPKELAELEKIVDEVLEAPKKKKHKTKAASKKVKTQDLASQQDKKKKTTKRKTTKK